MLSARGRHRNDTPPTRCPLCSRTGHFALKYHEFQITRREKKPNGYQRDGEHGGNGGGGRNDGGGGNSRGGKTAERAAIVEAEAVKITAREAVSRRKVARIPNPAIRSLFPPATSVYNPTKPRNAQTALPLQRRRPMPTPNMADCWVVSAPTLGLGCLSPQALTRLLPHVAPRARGTQMSTGYLTAVLPKI